MEKPLTAEEFRRLRRSLGLTQLELAKALGTTANTVARWEQGVHAVSPLARLALLALVQEHGGSRRRAR
jgi:DNA-binding transcriptional regulator YiaG